MAETVYNFTVADTSPMIMYSPYVAADDTTGGWASKCPTYVTASDGRNSYICDPDSAHTTSSYKASFQINFEGVGIYLVGNTTNSLGYDIVLDGVKFPGNPKPDSQLLYSATELVPGAHSIMLTVRQPSPNAGPGTVTFKQAVVVAGTGLAGATVTKNTLDDNDPTISYEYPTGGNWTLGNTYPQSIGPTTSTTFHESYWTDATATVNFQGTAVLAYGACYSHSRFAAYAASVDGAPESSFDGIVNLYSTGGDVKQRAGNCLRYFKTGLDPTQNHKLVLRVKDAGRVAVDWIEVFSVTGGSSTGGQGGPGSGGGSKPSSMVGILAGAISGGVVLVLALLTLAIFFRRRKHRRDEAEGEKHNTEPQHPIGYAVTPYRPNPSPEPQLQMPMPIHYNTGPTMPPWPQPQTPAPTVMGAMGMGNRLSVASSGAPLLSPGVASTYSSSSGPSWSTGPGPLHSNYAPGVENPGHTSTYSNMSIPAGMNTSMANSGSNMAVEAGGSSSQFDATSSFRQGAMSPPPPAYDQMSYVAPTPAPAGKQQHN
ncbi:hypothetical protein RhiLY_06999 [Ceratobasidium sp. AG-Ba]|nr:hypothetical protein RhiLY_06999 [Ceratobasidium sp. AG-Ba]